MKNLKKYTKIVLLASSFLFSCDKEETKAPEIENEEEVITDVTLTFTNTLDATDVVMATATDPDGDGVEELQINEEINLDVSKTYALSIAVENKLETPAEDITEEIEEEADEHQLFFGFTDNAFTNPMGDGNIDNATDPVDYQDQDDDMNPLGLNTRWTCSSVTLSGGVFTVRLQHQPDIKTALTGANDGDTDFELTFVLNIE